MDVQLKELLSFLHDKSPQVRQIALSNLLGYTPKGSAHREIFFEGIGGSGLRQVSENSCIRDLKLLCRDQLTIAHDAFRALVNLSDTTILNASLSEPTFLSFLVSYILQPQSILADLASMLLSNITTQALTCATLISLEIPIILHPSASPPFYPPQSRSGTSPTPSPYPNGETRNVLALPFLVQAFVQGAKVDKPSGMQSRKAELHFLSSVFANISMATAGRLFFLTPRPVDPLMPMSDRDLEYPLSQLLVFTEHIDTIRRGGVASTIKHCAFHVPAHKALLVSDAEAVSISPSRVDAPGMNALPYILLPLAGPEELDLEDQEKLPTSLQFLPDTKKREPDEILRLMHVETLLLLCTTRAGRDFLRSNGVYEIVKTMHLSEKNDKVTEHIERLVNLLKRDEAPISEEDDDGWAHGALETSLVDERAENASSGGRLGESEASVTASSLLDDEDEDNMIMEV